MSTNTPTARHAGKRDTWQDAVEIVIGLINLSAFFAGLLLCLDAVDGNWRIAMAMLLVLFGPGSGVVQLVGAFDTTVRVVLMVGLSVAISVLVAQLLLSLSALNVLSAAIPLTVITGIGLVVITFRFISYGSTKEGKA